LKKLANQKQKKKSNPLQFASKATQKLQNHKKQHVEMPSKQAYCCVC
jgi:uncharacterized Rmd1/YagE family protein